MDKLLLKIKNLKPEVLNNIGTVQDVLNAEFPSELLNHHFDARDFKYGFQIATPKTNEISSLGESVMINGYCYTDSTEPNSNYSKLIYGHEFISSDVFVIPNDAEPNIIVQGLSDATSITMFDFYNDLYQKIKMPLGFVALIEFEDFYGEAICKAPINHDKIFEHIDEFYTKPEVQLKNVYAYVIGAFADLNNISAGFETLFYKNPFDKKTSLTHHAHTLILNQNPGSLLNVQPEHGVNVFHVVAEKTKIKSIQGEVYIIENITKFKGEKSHE